MRELRNSASLEKSNKLRLTDTEQLIKDVLCTLLSTARNKN